MGVPGVPGAWPVTVKLRGADHWLMLWLAAITWTCQKYVPLGRPLTLTCVVPGGVLPRVATVWNDEVVLTSQG